MGAAFRCDAIDTPPRREGILVVLPRLDECSRHTSQVRRPADASQDTDCDVLYVVGGLYGNVAALDAGRNCTRKRQGLAVEVTNGDFNFFNASTDAWARINQGVRR